MHLKDNDIVIRPESFPHDVAACFSTRLGGVGTGEYAGMNPDPRRGWQLDIVIENAHELGRAAGFDAKNMYMVNQVHGNSVKRVFANECGTGLYRSIDTEADALITNEPETALTIFTADCTPILLYDPVKRAAAAVHAGWKGTALDIVGETISAMRSEFGTNPSDVYAAIGPCIDKCCFETHRDVPDAMFTVLGDSAGEAIVEKQHEANIKSGDEACEHKYFVDLKTVNRMLLERAGVKKENIEIAKHCTACETDIFWSHRRMGTARGSLAAVIMIRAR